MISTLQIIIIAFAYISLLFLIAYISDKKKSKTINPKRKALIYSFSLAIYCTSWTFYGAVGSAAESGWGYLPVFLGPILVYTLGWPLIKRFVKVGYKQNSTSISDFIASRFGKSQTIAAIVTIIAVIAIIPYIALQLKAITMSLEVFDAQHNLLNNHYLNSFFITFLLIIFSILFGTRNLDVTEHQYGIMNAIAFESVIKLVAFCSIGMFALFSIYSGPESLFKDIIENDYLNDLWFKNTNWENFFTQTILAAAAIFCLPRQFHVSVVEYAQINDLKLSRWVFPFYLALISIFVIPIAIAGSQYFINQDINADTYILALPLAEKQNFLSALAFIGGLSAATGMVIVATVSLSIMISNDLVLPVLLFKSRNQQFRDQKFNNKMLSIRRVAIAVCLMMSYAFYRLFDDSQSLASIGYLSFTAVLQFMPAILYALFWDMATKKGVIVGLISGIGIWFVLALIPSLKGEDLLSHSNDFFGLSLLTQSLFISLLVNSFLIYLFSKTTKQSFTEKVQAFTFTRTTPKDSKYNIKTMDEKHVFVKDLKLLASTIVGTKRMLISFETFSSQYNDQDVADKQLIDHTESLLSGSIGSSSARVVILSALREKSSNVDDVINLLSSTSRALKFNRNLIETTMDNITQGISVSDIDNNIIAWNFSYEQLMDYPVGLLQIGTPISKLIRFNAERGFCGPGEVDKHVAKRLHHLNSGVSYRFERKRTDNVVLEIVGSPLPLGGYVTTYTDISEYKRIQETLKRNERRIALYTDNSPALLAYIDTQLTFQFVNKAFARKINSSKEKILGKSVSEIFSESEYVFIHPYLIKALKNIQQQFEYPGATIDTGYYLLTYIPDLDTSNNVIGIYTISQDISNRRKAELALQEINTTLEQRVAMRTDELHATVKALEIAKEEAEKATKYKSRFLAAASHDLLQPFNAARLFSEMLLVESESMTKEQAQLVEKSDQSLKTAENIIRSLIDISKLDSGTVNPSIKTIDIHPTLELLQLQFAEIAMKKNIRLKVINSHCNILSDSDLLYRILQNLISNAIKYTPNGGKILIATRHQSENLRISIWDTGIGIKDENKKLMFAEFKQLLDPMLQSVETGIGLGLSISERISSILGHVISFNSVHTKGSVFHLSVRKSDHLLEIDNESNIIIPQEEPIYPGKRVLCVDNEKPNTEAMTMLFQRWGFEAQEAYSQNQIEDIIISGFIPDILVVDYQLDHNKTGLEFIELMRNQLGANIPAIVVTADHSNITKEKIKQSGLKLLYKPVKPAILRATINHELR